MRDSIMDCACSRYQTVSLLQPTCHVNHLPPYIQNYDKFSAKGVDVVAVVAANDPFVMSGWARVEGLKDKVRTCLHHSCGLVLTATFRSLPCLITVLNGPTRLVLTRTSAALAWVLELGVTLWSLMTLS